MRIFKRAGGTKDCSRGPTQLTPETKEEIVEEIGALLSKLEQTDLGPQQQEAAAAMTMAFSTLRSMITPVVLPDVPESLLQQEQQGGDSQVSQDAQSFRSHDLPAVPAAATVYRRHSIETCCAEEESIQPGALCPAVNSLVSLLWPRIEVYIRDMIKGSIEPLINAKLPCLMVKGVGGVKFTTVQLGNSSPSIGPIQVEHYKESGAIKLRIGIDVSCNLDVVLKAFGIPIGIRRFYIRGELSTLLAPPMMQPPFFGGVQVYFANPPDIDVGFAGAARIVDVPGLRGAIRGAIDSAVAGICVLPRRIAYDMNEENGIDAVDLNYPQPINIARFTLFSASNLIASHFRLFGANTSDPYVVVYLGIEQWTSPTIKRNLNPVWGKNGKGLTTDFPVHDLEQMAKVKVYDANVDSDDDLIGEVQHLEISTMVKDGEPHSLDLLKVDGQPGGGLLNVRTELLSLSLTRPTQTEDACNGTGPSEAHLSAKILTIHGLKIGAAHPLKVCMKVFGLADEGAKETVLVEDCTRVSQPKAQAQLAEAYQDIAKHLNKMGATDQDIAEGLDVTLREVQNFLATVMDDEPRKQILQAKLERGSTRRPQFDEVLQNLLPRGACNPHSYLTFEIIDSHQQTLATARLPMIELMAASNLELEGPFSTDVTDVHIIGTLRLRWLAPVSYEAFGQKIVQGDSQ